MKCDESSSVPDWIIDHPECAAVFAEFGIDTRCGGKSLEYVCVQQSVNLKSLLSRLQQVIERPAPKHD